MTNVVLSLLIALTIAPALASAQAPPPPTFEAAVSRTWKNVHNKILAMAKDTEFPEAKLSWKPHPDARSVGEELRHVTIGLLATSALARGEKFDFQAREKADAARSHTRASIVADMEAAIAESFPIVDAKPAAGLVGWIDHQGEHYGKLVTAYRVNGIVPPVSRPK